MSRRIYWERFPGLREAVRDGFERGLTDWQIAEESGQTQICVTNARRLIGLHRSPEDNKDRRIRGTREYHRKRYGTLDIVGDPDVQRRALDLAIRSDRVRKLVSYVAYLTDYPDVDDLLSLAHLLLMRSARRFPLSDPNLFFRWSHKYLRLMLLSYAGKQRRRMPSQFPEFASGDDYASTMIVG